MHRRLAILQAVVAGLEAAPNLAGIQITIGRVYPQAFTTLPMVNVAGGPDEREADLPTGPVDSRTLGVMVQCAVTASPEQLESALEQLVLDVERALADDPGVAALTDWFRYDESPAPAREELDAAVAMRELTYLARYTVNRANPV